jgi:hypothetical protein
LPADFLDQRRIVLAHLLLHPQFFQLHVEVEDFFQKIRRHDLLLDFAAGARLFSRALRLLFQFDAFHAQQVFRPLDGIFECAIRVVQLRALLQAPFLFTFVRDGIQIRMQLAAELVELAL